MTPKQLPKHSQAILAIDSQFFLDRGFANGLQEYQFERLYAEVDPYVSLRQRAYLERNPLYRQVLPYKILAQQLDGVTKIVAYRRLRTGGESRLYGLMSIGFGGHIDFEDVETYGGPSDSPQRSTIHLESTIRASSRRELGQEVHYLDFDDQPRPFVPEPHWIDPANLLIHYDLRDQLGEQWNVSKDVHSVHVAFVYVVRAPESFRFVSGEPEQIEMLAPMTPAELLASGMEMEEWTRLLLEYIELRSWKWSGHAG